ncbi:hypothetical protein LCGC14_2484910 [marine sediment metagenome]|uniref:Uncharacterized protein n=1 Tax=marine sediment metagenome TaxID=412755 RepID=A0A0F9B6E6_9ZZZZ
MRDTEYPKVTDDMSADEIVRVMYPAIMLNAMKEDERLFFILGLLKFDFTHLGEKLQEIMYK